MHFDSSTNITFIYIIALVGTTKLGEEIIIVLIATDQSSNINQTLSKNEWIEDLSLGSIVKQPVRLVVNDRKFPARTVFFSHTKPANSNNLRSYTIVSAPAEQALKIELLLVFIQFVTRTRHKLTK